MHCKVDEVHILREDKNICKCSLTAVQVYMCERERTRARERTRECAECACACACVSLSLWLYAISTLIDFIQTRSFLRVLVVVFYVYVRGHV